MAWSDDDSITAFDAEAGDIATLATSAQKIQWFNEGQTRLLRRKPTFDDVAWAATDRTIPLPADFVTLDRFIPDAGSAEYPWRVWGTYRAPIDESDVPAIVDYLVKTKGKT